MIVSGKAEGQISVIRKTSTYLQCLISSEEEKMWIRDF